MPGDSGMEVRTHTLNFDSGSDSDSDAAGAFLRTPPPPPLSTWKDSNFELFTRSLPPNTLLAHAPTKTPAPDAASKAAGAETSQLRLQDLACIT